MYYKNELDTMPGIYKCYGDIKYLRFKVRLEIVKSSMIPLSNVEEQETGLDPQYNEREEFEFSWNEKIFSPSEFRLYSDAQNCHNTLEKQFHNDITKLIANGTSSPSNRLFTYTSKEKVPKRLYRNIFYQAERRKLFFEDDNTSYISLQQSSPEKNLERLSLPVKNIIDFNPSDELRKRNRSLYSGYETMHIAADLSDKTHNSESSSCENEHLLVTIKWNKLTRTLTILPDFANFSTAGYKIDVDALSDTRYVYRYWILNISQSEAINNLGKIEKLTTELSSVQPHLNFSAEFDVPYKDFFNVFLFAEIQKAVGFVCDNLFIQYYIHLPEAWTSENTEVLSGLTQQCKCSDDVAQFSYLFETKLSLVVSELERSDQDSLSRFAMPSLFLEMCSLDGWKRFRVEGYAWITLPTTPGRHRLVLNSWRPASLTRRDELKRFFIGCDAEITDLTYIGVPADFKNTLLSRYGFECVSSGQVYIELNILHQIGKVIHPKKTSHLMDKAKTVMLMNSVNHILEAFKKARERMLLAREPVPFHAD